MNEVTIFNFGKLAVRSTIKEGEVWFVAQDVAETLGYRDAANMTRMLDEDERGTHIVSTLGGPQEVTIISESGLYACILKSQRPEARAFRKWVTGTVLPAIRKTGEYNHAQYLESLPGTLDQIEASLRANSDTLADLQKRVDKARKVLPKVKAPASPKEERQKEAVTLALGAGPMSVLDLVEVSGVPLTVILGLEGVEVDRRSTPFNPMVSLKT